MPDETQESHWLFETGYVFSDLHHRILVSYVLCLYFKDPLSPSSLRPKIFIEQKALDTIAHLCDGDARIGLNSLQLAVQAQVTSAQCNSSGEDGSQGILIKEEHIKEGLQRSHILYDKAGKSRCAYVFSVVSVSESFPAHVQRPLDVSKHPVISNICRVNHIYTFQSKTIWKIHSLCCYLKFVERVFFKFRIYPIVLV